MWKRYIPVRTVVAVPVLVLVILVLVFLASGLAKSAAERGASLALRTEVTFGSFRLSPFTGSLTFTDLAVRDPDRRAENLLVAKRGTGDLSVGELLRGRAVVDELLLSGVRCNVKRTRDGTFNVEELGTPEEKREEPPTPEEAERARNTDWVATLKKVAEKLNAWRKSRERAEQARKEGKREPPPPEAIRRGRATYIYRDEPRLVIRTIKVEELELELDDQTKEERLPVLAGSATIENLSSNPRRHDRPIEFFLGGKLGREAAQGTLGLDGALNLLRGDPASFGLTFNSEDVALALLKPLFGLSLPVNLEAGLGDVTVKDLALVDFSSLELAPRIVLRDLKLTPDGTHDTVLGIPAADFCEAVNRAKTFTIDGLTIAGTLSSPEFTWNAEFTENLKKLLADAGKAYLAAEVDEHLGKQTARLRKEAEKALGKELGKEAADAAKGILDGGLKEGLNLIPGLGATEEKKK
jgi:hypothetical protein